MSISRNMSPSKPRWNIISSAPEEHGTKAASVRWTLPLSLSSALITPRALSSARPSYLFGCWLFQIKTAQCTTCSCHFLSWQTLELYSRGTGEKSRNQNDPQVVTPRVLEESEVWGLFTSAWEIKASDFTRTCPRSCHLPLLVHMEEMQNGFLENSRLPLRSHWHALELLVMGSNYYIKYQQIGYRREWREAGGREEKQCTNGIKWPDSI